MRYVRKHDGVFVNGTGLWEVVACKTIIKFLLSQQKI